MGEAFEGKYTKIKGDEEYQKLWTENVLEFMDKNGIPEESVDKENIENIALEIKKNGNSWTVIREGPFKTVANTFTTGVPTEIESITGEKLDKVMVNFSRGYMIECGHRYELIREVTKNKLKERTALNASTIWIEYKRI